ncbi:MAG: hypothetical protein OEM02_14880 [Desulfobulbaceae bacterium]|nr:hypothetical protein [Desulfobulbaceae bacterium]
MCIDIRKTCNCGKHTVQLHMRDNILGEEAITELYCPTCSSTIDFNYKNMVHDNGWTITYDMILAKFLITSRLTIEPDNIQPGFLFDEGYATWQEMYPGEKNDIVEERQKILKLQEVDQQRYLSEISKWNIERIKRLKKEGWRKVQQA